MILDEKILRIIGVTIRDRIKSRIRTGKIKPESNNQGTTLVQSSRLLRSIKYQISGDKILIGTNLAYAKIQHEGGTITPKKAKYLAIPLQKIAKVKSPRDFQNTFIRNGIIFQKQADDKIIALYVLKKSVTIPARPYLFIDDQDEKIVITRITPLLEEDIKKELNK
jgi:phage gpG-like protein